MRITTQATMTPVFYNSFSLLPGAGGASTVAVAVGAQTGIEVADSNSEVKFDL